MIIELEIGVLIRIIANEVIVFCNCVVNVNVINEVEKILNTYDFNISEARFYIPEKFTKFTSKEVNLIQVGNYPAYKNNQIIIGGYIYELGK
jgi:hypothetical protein